MGVVVDAVGAFVPAILAFVACMIRFDDSDGAQYCTGTAALLLMFWLGFEFARLVKNGREAFGQVGTKDSNEIRTAKFIGLGAIVLLIVALWIMAVSATNPKKLIELFPGYAPSEERMREILRKMGLDFGCLQNAIAPSVLDFAASGNNVANAFFVLAFGFAAVANVLRGKNPNFEFAMVVVFAALSISVVAYAGAKFDRTPDKVATRMGGDPSDAVVAQVQAEANETPMRFDAWNAWASSIPDPPQYDDRTIALSVFGGLATAALVSLLPGIWAQRTQWNEQVFLDVVQGLFLIAVVVGSFRAANQLEPTSFLDTTLKESGMSFAEFVRDNPNRIGPTGAFDGARRFFLPNFDVCFDKYYSDYKAYSVLLTLSIPLVLLMAVRSLRA